MSFKRQGGVARILRSSPQFGVTLATYEFLHTLVPVDFGGSAAAPSKVDLKQENTRLNAYRALQSIQPK